MDAYGTSLMADSFQPGGRPPAPPPLDLVQDFVNTEVPDFGQDELATPAELVGWLVGRGLVTEGTVATQGAFRRARGIRHALRLLALANAHGEPPTREEARTIDAALASVPVRLRLEDRVVGVAPRGTGVDGALAAILAVVAEAERDGSWRRVKACVQHSCGWVFYDASRNHSSSWCSMRVCGNRTKVAAARSRRRA
jgi:predicted RNA-binding Zn ribbon-like protein